MVEMVTINETEVYYLKYLSLLYNWQIRTELSDKRIYILPEEISHNLKNCVRNTKKVRWFPIRLIQTSKFRICYIWQIRTEFSVINERIILTT